MEKGIQSFFVINHLKKECKQDSERTVKRVTPSSRSGARIPISPKKKSARNKTRSKMKKPKY